MEEAVFAALLMVQDLAQMRDAAENLWNQYKLADLDLAAVSVAINTAIELARSLEEDMKELIEHLGGSQVLLQIIWDASSRAIGLSPQDKQRPGDAFNMATFDLACDSLAAAGMLLDAYRRANPKGSWTSYNGKFGWYDEDMVGSGLSNRQKWSQFQTALMEMLGDIDFMGSTLKTAPVEYELIRGIRQMQDTGKVPIWVCFAAQLYYDTLTVLGPRSKDGNTELRKTRIRMQKTLANVPTKSKEWQQLVKDLAYWENDVLYYCRDAMKDELGMNGYYPFKFLERHPLYCGLWIHHLRSSFHKFGAIYAAGPGGVMCTAQLYHALKLEGLVAAHWEDLEKFMDMQGNSTFFVGEPPTTVEAHFKNFCFCLGMSTTNWAPNKRKGPLQQTQATVRNLKFKGWAPLIIRDRIVTFVERRLISSEKIEQILEAGRKSQRVGREEVKTGENVKATDSNTTITPANLIEQVARTITLEVPDLLFDNWTLHNQCWKLLLDMKRQFSEHLGLTDMLNKAIPREEQLPSVVGYVFSTAAGKMDLKKTSTSRMDLMVAAEIMTTFLSEGSGHIIRDEANVIIDPDEKVIIESGHTAEQLWRTEQALKRAAQAGNLESCAPQ
ncbi:hypothetical protein GGR57DRAFT_518763 [Xylariaceae sp. FL1272]|nr:hypothetical protein GGR57DRAFT_518763 [Xylariaceae sp. FL1272]